MMLATDFIEVYGEEALLKEAEKTWRRSYKDFGEFVSARPDKEEIAVVTYLDRRTNTEKEWGLQRDLLIIA